MLRLTFALLVALAPAGEANLTVAGDLPNTGPMTLSDLKAAGAVTVEWTAHGHARKAAGVPLDKVLAKAGFSPGPMGKDVPVRDKRSGWKKAVVATASDGFQAVFSCAELFPEMGPTRAVIAWEIDGKPLSADEGPLRLVVTTDKEPARSLRNLVKIEVVDLRGR
jgi:DMSO/TMAO reductase YedYZ molybdopterin-dependent catalytic subunit